MHAATNIFYQFQKHRHKTRKTFHQQAILISCVESPLFYLLP